MRATTIDRDSQHPRLERSHAIPVFQITNRPNERLLSDILCVLTMPQLTHADREDQPLKLLDKLQQPVSVTGQAAYDESPVIHLAASLSGDEYPSKERRVSGRPEFSGEPPRFAPKQFVREPHPRDQNTRHSRRLTKQLADESKGRRADDVRHPLNASQRVICSRANCLAIL